MKKKTKQIITIIIISIIALMTIVGLSDLAFLSKPASIQTNTQTK